MNVKLVTFAMMFLLTLDASSQIGGKAGAFSRMGFGARGMGMGNALTAVTSGDVVAYNNPAAIQLSEYRNISAAFGILTLDRKLNFISYSQPLRPSAGISAGLINSGVSKIDGRDSDGEPTGPLRTSENQFFFAFANQFKAGFSIGINIKLYYHHIYTDVSTTTVGIDAGLLVPINEDLTVGATVRDINSQYKWDTSELYGQSGNTTIDNFPLLYTLGSAYRLPDSLGLIALDVQATNQKTLMARIGAEVPLIPELTLRAGLDRIDLKEKGSGIQPTFGFTLTQNIFEGWTPSLHYAYVIEPFASSGMHIIALSVKL